MGFAARAACRAVSSRLLRGARLWRRHVRASRGLTLILIAGAFLTGGTSTASQQPESPSEYQVKAAIVYNFAKFVDWPATAFADDHAPFVICVAGEDPFGTALTEIVARKSVKGRSLVVKHPKEEAELRSCHILFVSSSEKKRLVKLLEILKGSCVLTIGEMDRFAQSGGMINFVLEENHVRLEINVGATGRAGLKVSSKLLEMARIVADSRDGGRV